MNNNIVFDNDNDNSDSNAELLKNNTPNTVDYNKLYNTNNIPVNNIKNSNNEIKDVSDNITSINNTKITPINKPAPTVEPQKKKGLDSLLFIFLLFIVIMGIIMFLFPLFSKYLFG